MSIDTLEEITATSPSIEEFPKANTETEYRSTGFIFGKYQSTDWVGNGVLETTDGVKIPTKLTSKMASLFQRYPHMMEQAYLWSVWIRTGKEGEIKLSLKCFLTAPSVDEQNLGRMMRTCQDNFSIRGQLQSWDFQKGLFRIEIKRNQRPPQNVKPEFKWLYDPFKVIVFGELPEKMRKGQFWEVSCDRKTGGSRLSLVSASLIKQPLMAKRQNKGPVAPPVKREKPKKKIAFTPLEQSNTQKQSVPVRTNPKPIAPKPRKVPPLTSLVTAPPSTSDRQVQLLPKPQRPTK